MEEFDFAVKILIDLFIPLRAAIDFGVQSSPLSSCLGSNCVTHIPTRSPYMK